jgi:hypothetical protein
MCSSLNSDWFPDNKKVAMKIRATYRGNAAGEAKDVELLAVAVAAPVVVAVAVAAAADALGTAAQSSPVVGDPGGADGMRQICRLVHTAVRIRWKTLQ